MAALGLLVLRLTLATVLVAHGAHQMFGSFSGPGLGAGGLSMTAAYFEGVGVSPGFPAAVVAAVIQLVAGGLIGIGWLARWAAVSALIYHILIMWKVHAAWGFFLNWLLVPSRGHGVELSLVMAGALTCVMLAGAGDWSIDGLRAKSRASRAAGRARLHRA